MTFPGFELSDISFTQKNEKTIFNLLLFLQRRNPLALDPVCCFRSPFLQQPPTPLATTNQLTSCKERSSFWIVELGSTDRVGGNQQQASSGVTGITSRNRIRLRVQSPVGRDLWAIMNRDTLFDTERRQRSSYQTHDPAFV